MSRARNVRKVIDKHASRVERGNSQILGEKVIKEKFLEKRVNKPLVPMNELQRDYIDACNDPSVNTILCTGFAGTSKTYIPSVIAADLFSLGKIKKIYIIRPPISKSKSLGFFSGSLLEKALCWAAPVMQVLIDRLGHPVVDIALKSGTIELIPMETIKGRSLQDCWILCDEAEDLTIEELKKVVTRQGKNSKLILSGDIMQCDLTSKSGLLKGIEMADRHPELGVVVINFDRPADIVRSGQVKQWILAFNREGL